MKLLFTVNPKIISDHISVYGVSAALIFFSINAQKLINSSGNDSALEFLLIASAILLFLIGAIIWIWNIIYSARIVFLFFLRREAPARSAARRTAIVCVGLYVAVVLVFSLLVLLFAGYRSGIFTKP